MCMVSCVQLSATPWTVPCQASLSMEVSRQEYCNGWPFPPPGYLPDPGIEPVFHASPASAGGFVVTSAAGGSSMMLHAHKALLEQVAISFSNA